MTRTYDHNGETREIREPDIADDLLADLLASYYGKDRTYIRAARDRILCLAKEKAELAGYVRQLEDGVQRAFVASNETAAIVQGVTADVLAKLTALSEQRAELLSFIRKVGFGFDCDNDAHKYGTTCRKCEARTLIAKLTQPPWPMQYTQPSPATGAESESGL